MLVKIFFQIIPIMQLSHSFKYANSSVVKLIYITQNPLRPIVMHSFRILQCLAELSCSRENIESAYEHFITIIKLIKRSSNWNTLITNSNEIAVYDRMTLLRSMAAFSNSTLKETLYKHSTLKRRY